MLYRSDLDLTRFTGGAGFTTGRPYALTGPMGTFVTDQYVKAAHGKATREFPFIAASSGKFTEVRTLSSYPALPAVLLANPLGRARSAASR